MVLLEVLQRVINVLIVWIRVLAPPESFWRHLVAPHKDVFNIDETSDSP